MTSAGAAASSVGVGEKPRLDVLCLGAATVVEQAMDPGARCVASVALLCRNEPMLLVGAGPGVLRQALHHLGSIPSAVYLPSAQVAHTGDLQAIIEYEASYHRKVSVYAAGDVLDAAISAIDEDIVGDVRTYVEFLQLELGAPTPIHPHYFLLTQRCETKHPRYNACILDTYQKPCVAVIDGPLAYTTVFQQAPCVIVRMFKGFVAQSLYDALDRAKLLVIGYPAETRLSMPAAALRAGDSFVAPSVKGGTAASPTGRDQHQTSRDSVWITNNGEGRAHMDFADRHGGDDVDDYTRVTQRPAPARDQMSFDDARRSQQQEQRQQYGYPTTDGAVIRDRRSQWGVSSAPTGGPAGHAGGAPSSGGGFGNGGGGGTYGYGYGQHTAERHTVRGQSPPPGASGRRTPGGAAGHRPYSGGGGGASGSMQHSQSGRGRAPPGVPRKLYVFNNEVKEAEPVIVMVPGHMTLAALKAKIGSILNVKPFGQLYTVDGGIVRDTAELHHCQEVVATKHAGAPFDLDRLPYGMEFTRPAAPIDMAAPEYIATQYRY